MFSTAENCMEKWIISSNRCVFLLLVIICVPPIILDLNIYCIWNIQLWNMRILVISNCLHADRRSRSGSQPFDNLMVFLEEFFEWDNFWQKSAENKSVKNYPASKYLALLFNIAAKSWTCRHWIVSLPFSKFHIQSYIFRERSGSVVECLTRDRGAAG